MSEQGRVNETVRVDAVPEIHREAVGDANIAVADNGQVKVRVVGSEQDPKQMLRLRRAVRTNGEQVCWLLAQLDDVHVYIDGNTVVVTRDGNILP